MNELLEAYHYYDKDHSGTIDKDEIQDVFRCIGDDAQQCTRAQP